MKAIKSALWNTPQCLHKHNEKQKSMGKDLLVSFLIGLVVKVSVCEASQSIQCEDLSVQKTQLKAESKVGIQKWMLFLSFCLCAIESSSMWCDSLKTVWDNTQSVHWELTDTQVNFDPILHCFLLAWGRRKAVIELFSFFLFKWREHEHSIFAVTWQKSVPTFFP